MLMRVGSGASWHGLVAGAAIVAVLACGLVSPGSAALGRPGVRLSGVGEVAPPNSGLVLFGESVSISADGSTALVGAPGDAYPTGAAYVFTWSGTSWTQQARLTPSDAVGGPDTPVSSFGNDVALSADGSTALIGGSSDRNQTGAAWVFTRTGGNWAQQGAKLGPGDTATSYQFGWSVALAGDGNTALVGGIGGVAGAVWAFTRTGSTWAQQGPTLAPNDAASTQQLLGPQFGFSLAISADGRTALIGGPGDGAGSPKGGAAWVFTRAGSSWTQQGAKLTGSDESQSRFGSRVALSGDGSTALVGGPADGGTAQVPNPIGAGWIFIRTDTTWSQDGAKLTASDESGTGNLGESVALSADGSTALIGGALDDGNHGAAWDFTRVSGAWVQSGAKVAGENQSAFGTDVALSADASRALIGAPGNSNYQPGNAWSFGQAAPPSAPAGVSAVAGNGQATISFDPPALDGGAAIASYRVVATPGAAAASGAGSPITVTGLTNGTAYTFAVTATNTAGTGPASAPSNPVTPTATGGGDGGGNGGGGGGGGGGILPDLLVALSASSPSVPSVGSELDFYVTVSMKNVGNQSEGRLALALPSGYAVNRVYTDRGTCQTAEQMVNCNVAWINRDTSTHVTVFGTVTQQRAMDVTAIASGLLEPEWDPSNNALTLVLPLPTVPPPAGGGGGNTPPPPPVTPPTVTGSARVGKTLMGKPGIWGAQPTRVSYQWQLCTGKRCLPIAGATTRQLKLRPAYAGHSIRLVVTATVAGKRIKSVSTKVAIRAS